MFKAHEIQKVTRLPRGPWEAALELARRRLQADEFYSIENFKHRQSMREIEANEKWMEKLK